MTATGSGPKWDALKSRAVSEAIDERKRQLGNAVTESGVTNVVKGQFSRVEQSARTKATNLAGLPSARRTLQERQKTSRIIVDEFTSVGMTVNTARELARALLGANYVTPGTEGGGR